MLERLPIPSRGLKRSGDPTVQGASQTGPELVRASWQRCTQAGLHRHGQPRIEVLTAAETEHRRQRAQHAHRLAHAELQTLARQIAGSNFLLAFADPEGVILELTADQRFLSSGSGAQIRLGSLWAESMAGTNGLGTALASGSPASIDGSDHFFHSLHDIACTAAPVRNGHGEIVGVLDASSYVRTRQTHTMALVQMSAMQVENRLLLEEMATQVVLAIHPRPEFLGTLSEGLIAFDHDGRVCALNDRAARVLSGLPLRIGTSFEALFPEGFGEAVRRLATAGAMPLTDAMGSTVAARLAARPIRRTDGVMTTVPSADLAAQPAASGAGAGGRQKGLAGQGPAWAARAAQAEGPELLADDPRVEEALKLARRAVRMGVPLLIEGETGTGKELLARHAHVSSARRGGFVAVNCGSLPAELIEAELFGYVGGAFTGARREGSPGLIASAEGGTLLLDEIAELPLPLQASLLRFLDDGVVRPVGGVQGRKVDVQMLAASLTDLRALAAQGRFRKDLLYRLDVAHVRLPPLRERSDLPRAITLTLGRLQPEASFTVAALERLCAHDWPGNFRELRSVLTRALLRRDPTDPAAPLEVGDILSQLDGATPGGAVGPPSAPSGPRATSAEAAPPGRSARLQEAATQTVVQRYSQHARNVSLVARELGISRTTVYRHLRRAGLHGLPVSDEPR